MPSDRITLGDVVIATRIVPGSSLKDLSLTSSVLPNETLSSEVVKWAANLPARVLTMPNWHNEVLAEAPTLGAEFTGGGPLAKKITLSFRQHFRA